MLKQLVKRRQRPGVYLLDFSVFAVPQEYAGCPSNFYSCDAQVRAHVVVCPWPSNISGKGGSFQRRISCAQRFWKLLDCCEN